MSHLLPLHLLLHSIDLSTLHLVPKQEPGTETTAGQRLCSETGVIAQRAHEWRYGAMPSSRDNSFRCCGVSECMECQVRTDPFSWEGSAQRWSRDSSVPSLNTRRFQGKAYAYCCANNKILSVMEQPKLRKGGYLARCQADCSVSNVMSHVDISWEGENRRNSVMREDYLAQHHHLDIIRSDVARRNEIGSHTDQTSSLRATEVERLECNKRCSAARAYNAQRGSTTQKQSEGNKWRKSKALVTSTLAICTIVGEMQKDFEVKLGMSLTGRNSATHRIHAITLANGIATEPFGIASVRPSKPHPSRIATLTAAFAAAAHYDAIDHNNLRRHSALLRPKHCECEASG
ncbi:unnamed protein product [Hydatigera taeniaeformis]|uniref:Uncharacterized protein n=1 Tax=Hydatigena taeniaeformis TaxID=6205 RepID=A0A3P7FI86_HYDTA|nr:unnamed protein product [Hydatigera taeniaeformis]